MHVSSVSSLPLHSLHFVSFTFIALRFSYIHCILFPINHSHIMLSFVIISPHFFSSHHFFCLSSFSLHILITIITKLSVPNLYRSSLYVHLHSSHFHFSLHSLHFSLVLFHRFTFIYTLNLLSTLSISFAVCFSLSDLEFKGFRSQMEKGSALEVSSKKVGR